ncbi:MAG: trypsin-like peptidase domain-containing protein [Chlorobi bacterium]|nr:trypsin-like peptidase domain-containing protein [Chlorobiota bacterium]
MKQFTHTLAVALFLTSGFSSCMAQDRNSSPELHTIDASEVDSLEWQKLDEANRLLDNSRRTAITSAVETVAPAVVGINVTEVREVRGYDPWAYFESDPFFRDFMDMFPRRGSRTYRQKLHGLGSGFLISPDGYVITNDHVAGQASEVVVTTTDGKEHKAEIIGTDHTSDVALLKIEGEDFPYLEIGNSNDVIVGEWVIALGNPFGLFDINAKPAVTVGVVSNVDINLRPQNDRVYIGMIQTDAAISSGNSGGPLVNAIGQVIGMNTVIYSTAQNYRGAGSIGIGFSVPINRVMGIVEELKKHGKIDRDFWTGINVRSIDNNIAKYLNLESTQGAVIVEVAPRSPATVAGLEVGDVIVEVNQKQIRTHEDLSLVVNDARVEDVLDIKIFRKGEEMEKKLILSKRR